jgi:hypothetical protein
MEDRDSGFEEVDGRVDTPANPLLRRLDAVQLDLLEAVWDPVLREVAPWPVWDYVARVLYRSEAAVVDAEAVLGSLPAVSRADMYNRDYGLVWRSRGSKATSSEDERVGLSIAGLYQLGSRDPAVRAVADDLARLIGAIAAAERELAPDPTRALHDQPMPLAGHLKRVTVVGRGFTIPLPAAVVLDVLTWEMAPLRILGDDPDTATASLTRWLRPFIGVATAADYLERVRRVSPTPAPTLHVNPADLPRSLDHLSYVLRDHPAWKCPPLVNMTELAAAATLSHAVADRDQFTSCMTALATVLGRLNTPQPPTTAGSDKPGSLVRLRLWLAGNITDASARERVSSAIEDMRAAVALRIEAQHSSGDTFRNAARARARLGLPEVIYDWADAWDTVRSRVANAADVLRQEVQLATLDPAVEA